MAITGTAGAPRKRRRRLGGGSGGEPKARRVGALWLFVGLVPIVASCGSQVPHDRVVAAAGGSYIAGAGSGSGPGTGPTGAGATTSAGGQTGSGTTTGAGSIGAGATDPAAAGGGGAGGGGAAGGEGGGAGAAAANGSPVTIGNIGSYSGVLGSVFPGGPAAAQAWAQSVNARGGLNGHPVRLVTGDDGGDPSRALSLARQMVEEQGAIAFMGNMMPLSLSGIRPYLEQNNIPLVGGDVTLPDWIESPMIFPQGTDVTSISVAAINLMRQAGGTKLAILFCGESPSCKRLSDGAASNPPAGMTVVYTAQISIVQTDFTTECLQAKSKGADAIFVAADANTVIRVGRSCSQQSLRPLYSTASIAVGPQLAGDPNMEGLVAPINNVPWFDTSTPGGAEFVQSMQTYVSGAPLAAPAASMYASGKLIEAAASALGATPTAAELIAGLRSLSGETAAGMAPPLTFGSGGSGPIPCYFVVRVSGGQWTAPNGASPVCP